MEIYLVGGAIRDKLLGLEVSERDWVVVGATETDMLIKQFQKVGKNFPVFLHPETHEEYALARTEKKTGKGYDGFECKSTPKITLIEDLKRRDLTINAMAETKEGRIIDPFGGQQAIQQRLLIHVSSAFSEDPLRILRVARLLSKLSSFGFKIASETAKLLSNMVMSGEVRSLTSERVWKEFSRALAETKPTIFIQTLRACGALADLFPSLDKLWGILQNGKYLSEIDTGVHVSMALNIATQLTSDPKIRFAVLCHDLGIVKSTAEQLHSYLGYGVAGVSIIKAWCRQYRVPKAYRDLAILVARWHVYSHRAFELKSTTLVKMLYHMDVFRKPERFEAFLIAAESDARGHAGRQDIPYLQAVFLRNVAKVAKEIVAKPLIAVGLKGKKLGSCLYRARVLAVKVFRQIKLNEKVFC